jgi:hypothetical protein
MKRYSFAACLTLAVITVLGLGGLPEARPDDPDGNVVSGYAKGADGVRVIWGESAIVDGSRIATWALVDPHDGTILAAGATFSLDLADEMPAPGDGPDGAIASLEFPAVVQEATFLYHLEIQSNPHGHATPPGNVNPNRNAVPHFDFHFYSIPEEMVWLIPGQTAPPAPPAVPADLLPAGYRQPGPSIAEMGRHSAPNWSFTDPNPLSTIMLAGFLPDGSRMHFLEPMISRDVLLGAENFTLDMPMPKSFGSEMLYPTKFQAVFHGNACSLVFSDFVKVQ